MVPKEAQKKSFSWELEKDIADQLVSIFIATLYILSIQATQ